MKLLLPFWLLACLCLSPSLFSQAPPESQYVWKDAAGEGRFQVVVFRKSFQLKEKVDSARLSLFADSRYQLFVNGTSLNTGPARSYPAHPEYDTYELRPYLKTGQNLIAVRVWSNGTSSFQLRKMPGAFIAWGEISLSNGTTVSLATPGDWRCLPLQGYDADMPKMSFALGPMERYDARKDPPDWHLPGRPILDLAVMARKNQAQWGQLSPRSIPFLSQEIRQPRELLGVYPLLNQEEFLSFRVSVPDNNWNEFRTGRWLFGHTYLYSPKDQAVEVGLWWGEHYLNGESIEQEAAGDNRPHRQAAVLNLKEGWNEFFVKRKSFFGKWDFFMAYPKSAGLLLSTNKRKDSPFWFQTLGPVEEAEEEQLNELSLPFSPKSLPKNLSTGWIGKTRDSKANNPAVEMSWRYFDEAYATSPHQVENLSVNDPAGTALLYDFRYKQLGRIVVEYEAPAGTTLDVGFSEDLKNGRPFLNKRDGIYPATRHIAREGSNRLETLKPYGLRYLQLAVSENSGPVTIKRVYVVRQVYPFEQVGSFECSDPLLNAIWQLGWRTLEVCAEDSYTDTPFRERGLYAGDMLPQMGVTLAGSGDLRLIKRSLRLFQDMYADQFFPQTNKHPDEIGLLEDYPLLSFEALRWYVDRTGDWDFAKELLPNYEYLLRTQLAKREQNGLIQNERVFIEWTQIEKGEVANAAYHALLARVCQGMSRLYRQIGETDKAGEFAAFAESLTQSLSALYWDESKKVFRDGIKEGKNIEHHYPISSGWPLLFGLTTPEQEASIVPHITESLKDIGEVNRRRLTTPYGSFYLLLALAQQEEAGAAEAFIRKHWGPMVYRHDDTAWENFGDEGIGTLSHAWSAAPTYYLSSQVLGLDLGYPGPSNPDSIVIAPLAEQIDWAKGVIPHPKGEIRIDWRVEGELLWLNCEVPDGVHWEVRPRGRLANKQLWVNGERK